MARPGDYVSFLKTVIAAFCGLLVTSCQAIRDETDSSVSVRGGHPTLEQMNVASGTGAQNLFVDDLIRKAGLTNTPGVGDGNWGVVTEAGIYEIGRQCDQYLDVLFRFNRNQRAMRQGMTATGATTATILGLVGAAAMPIAITAAAFGLSASLYDAGVSSVLFTVEPSALRTIVLKGRQLYIEKLDLTKINNRPRMMIALQGYLSQCSPSTIEGNVNNAASGADSVVSARPGAASNAATMNAPALTLIQRSQEITNQPFTVTPAVPDDNLARNRKLPTEVSITKRMLMDGQKVLGVEPDGNFGPTDDSATRIAIKEFQRGANRRNERFWPEVDTKGIWTPRTNLLRVLSPMNRAIFKTPFERAYLGGPIAEGDVTTQLTSLDRDQVVAMLAFLNIPRASRPAADSPNFLPDAMKLMRARLAELRVARNIEPQKGGELDSVLFDSLANSPP